MSNVTITKFWRQGCRPCAMLDGVLTKLGIDYTSVNIDEQPDVIERYDLTSVPVLVFERDGVELDRIVGLVGEHMLQAKLNELEAK